MRRNREHGRILSVETMQRGSALDADAAAGATSITVTDAGDFDEDGGWLYVGAQVVEFTACDDDTGVLTLADPLVAAGEQGDPVAVYDPLYGEVVDYQVALVQLDGEYDNPDPVEAEVAEGVPDLPEGDRGKAGESCTLLRVADDEWEVVGVGGRSRKSRGIRFEKDDAYTITSTDLDPALNANYPNVVFPLTHRPIDESVDARWRTTPQEPTEFTVNYDAPSITWPLSGFEAAGDRLWVHYAYRRGLSSDDLPVPYSTPGWAYLQVAMTDSTDRSAPAFDDSGWATGSTPFGSNEVSGVPAGWTSWDIQTGIWLRKTIRVSPRRSVTVTVDVDNIATIYWNGTQVGHFDFSGMTHQVASVTIPATDVAQVNTLAVRAQDDTTDYTSDGSFIDVKVEAT